MSLELQKGILERLDDRDHSTFEHAEMGGKRKRCKQEDGAETRVAMLGLDVDEALIERAKKLAAAAEAEADGGQDNKGDREGKKQKNDGATVTAAAAARLPIHFEAVDIHKCQDKADAIMKAFLGQHDRGGDDTDAKFDLITIFSTTMWIHLVYGEDALKECLRFAASSARCLLVEPQDFHSYKAAKKRLRKLHLTPSSYFK